MKHPVANELHREFCGPNGLNFAKGYNSASREQMFASHIGQTLVVKGATERYIQTGMEREYGKYTFSLKMPVDADIIKIIKRYPETLGVDSINFNPQTVVIYEDANTKQIGIMNLPLYCSHHQYFGFEYKAQPGLSEIKVGASIAKGTMLMDSPSITPNGGYKFGVECNMAYMSHPAVSEDGIMICRDVLERFKFKTYETRVVEWGSKSFPLNLYGDLENFKPFPDIGEYITREDGLLMCLRPHNKELAIVEQGIYDIMEPDYSFDKGTYVSGKGGRIVDIRLHHDSRNLNTAVQPSMDAQAEKYDNARIAFYKSILAEYDRLHRERGIGLQTTPEFHNLVVEALSVVSEEKERIIKLYRKTPLDDWRFEFVIEYELTPTIGFKLTDCHGGKGVICYIAEPHEMPVDKDGNRADLVMDALSTFSRMNLGRLYEQYFNSVTRGVAADIARKLGIGKNDRGIRSTIMNLSNNKNPDLDVAWQHLMGLYKILSPVMYKTLSNKPISLTHFESVLEAGARGKGLFLYSPPDSEVELSDAVIDCEKFYPTTFGPVTYTGYSGKQVTTAVNVRIGSVYIIILEKIGDDGTAVSSGKYQHFGVLSQVTNTDKYSQPFRNQAIRALGESEIRIYVSYAGALVTADLLDRNNNPATHKQMLKNILSAKHPTNIDHVVDRSIIPLGGAKPLQLVKHVLECSGLRFAYKPYVPTYGQRPYA
jgi:hypothetical protein